MVGVHAHLGRQVEGHRKTRGALRKQVAVALIRLRGRPETRVLPHRPEAAAVHGRLDATGERKYAGQVVH